MAFKEKGLKIGHVNTRSWLKKMEETFIVMNGVDILGISKTWLNTTHTDTQISIEGYGIVRSDRIVRRVDTNENKKGGGLIFYLKQKYWLHTIKVDEIIKSTPD